MKGWRISGAVILLFAFTACFLWFKWKHDEPRRHSLEILEHLRVAVQARSSAILDQIVLPQALAGQTTVEQTEFLTKALIDEVSADGITALKKSALFGPLKELFPQEASGWAQQAGVNPDECVAFRMEHQGLRAEVVLLRASETYRVVRCNNIKQMAGK